MVVLTKKQVEIKRLYFGLHLTQAKIASRLGTTQQSISKQVIQINRKLGGCKKKGVVTPQVVRKDSKYWRFHALHFIVTPYYFYPRYSKILFTRGNRNIYYGDWKINLHEKTIEIILRRGYDFEDKNKYSAIQKAEDSLNRMLYYLSNEYGFEYEKEGRITIKLVKQHLANTNSPLAKQQKGQFIQIKGFDGKVWFLIDKSKGLVEHEYVHSGRLLSDSERIEAFLNDLREHENLSLSGLDSNQNLIMKSVKELTVQIKLHLEVQNHTLKVQSETLKTLKLIQKSLS